MPSGGDSVVRHDHLDFASMRRRGMASALRRAFTACVGCGEPQGRVCTDCESKIGTHH